MNNNQELTRALTIVQNKLNACHAQKTDVLNKVNESFFFIFFLRILLYLPASIPDVD